MQIKDRPSPSLVTMIDRAAEGRRAEDMRTKLGLILGQHFEKVTVTEVLVVEQEGTTTVVDPVELRVVKGDNQGVVQAIEMVLENIAEAEAPLAINLI